jgi:hypothetical protein
MAYFTVERAYRLEHDSPYLEVELSTAGVDAVVEAFATVSR